MQAERRKREENEKIYEFRGRRVRDSVSVQITLSRGEENGLCVVLMQLERSEDKEMRRLNSKASYFMFITSC